MQEKLELQEKGTMLTIQKHDNQLVIDSREVAKALGIQHKNLIETIKTHQETIEIEFLALTFQTEVLKHDKYKGSTRTKYILLTEDQSIFIGTLSKNTKQVVDFKAKLVKAFASARRGGLANTKEYDVYAHMGINWKEVFGEKTEMYQREICLKLKELYGCSLSTGKRKVRKELHFTKKFLGKLYFTYLDTPKLEQGSIPTEPVQESHLESKVRKLELRVKEKEAEIKRLSTYLFTDKDDLRRKIAALKEDNEFWKSQSNNNLEFMVRMSKRPLKNVA